MEVFVCWLRLFLGFLCVGSVFGCGHVYGAWFVGGGTWFDRFGCGTWFGFGGGWIFGGGIVAGCWCVGGATHPYDGPGGGQGIVYCGGRQA